MKRNARRRLGAVLAALALLTALFPAPGRAAAEGVYFTAVNEQPLELTAETMPFWSDGVLYVSSRLFEGTDAGVTYARNDDLAILYNRRSDLRFDLAAQTCYDRQGVIYNSHAIDRGGVVFFPLALVCRYFTLSWTYTETSIAPLIRVTTATAILDDASYIDAAMGVMKSYYAAYLRSITPPPSVTPPPVTPPVTPPPVTPPVDDPLQAAEGQKIYLILDCPDADAARGLLARLDGVQATFLLDVEQMEDGDLLRGLVCGGHAVALRCAGETAEQVAEELRRARELFQQACCAWLELVWYEGGAPVEELLEEGGYVRVRAVLDRRQTDLTGNRAASLLRTIGRFEEDLGVCLDGGGGLNGLTALLAGLEEAQYRLCAWRLTA